MFAPDWTLPNIPGATSTPFEWEAAALDLVEGYFGDRTDPYYGFPRIIPVFAWPDEPGPIAVIPPLPVEAPPQKPPVSSGPVILPVLPGSVAGPRAEVPTEVVVVEDVSTEVEHHPEGDFPAGSIFAPGQTWGNQPHDFDAPLEQEEENVAIDWGGVVDWALETIAGEQPWQAVPAVYSAFAAPNIPAPQQLPPPSGIPGNPAQVEYQMAATGDACGNRRYVTLDRSTGKISCKRRRRRRLLTNRDLADLASLKTITGGGAALNAAVIRAVR